MQLLQDLKFGIRMLVKQPTLSVISIVALALGIGLTTTMYSIVHGASRDLPIEEPWELMDVARANPSQGANRMSVTQHEYLDWSEQQSSFERLGGLYQGTVTLAGTERPIRYEGAFMTPSVFRVLGVRPLLGRLFSDADAEPGAEPVIVLGYRTWQNDFQGDPSVIGRSARINGVPGTIIGVTEDNFRFPMDEDAWVPLMIDTTALDRGEGMQLMVVGRLRDGVDAESALEEMNTIAARIEADWPELNEGVRAAIQPYTENFMGDDIMTMLWTMQGAVFMVLLIACANVANLLLSRAFDRSREVAVRTALGAGRWRIVRQFMVEVFVLAAIGGIIGLGIAQVGVTLFNGQLASIEKPYWVYVSIDWAILLFTTFVVLMASLVAGVVPALKVTGSDLHDVLKDEARGSSGFRMGRITKGLVIAEMALSCALLVGAGLMIKSVGQLSNLDYGYPTDVFTARIGLFESEYPTVEERLEFFDELQRRMQAIPGARAASLGTALPGTQRASMTRVTIQGESYATREDHPLANFAVAAPGLFEAFEVELLQGRDFSVQDTADSEAVTIVNASLAERLFPGQNPLGQRLKLGIEEDDGNPWLTVIGVVPDLHMEGVSAIGQREPQGLYLPLQQNDRRFMSLVVRADGDSMALGGAVRQAVTSINSDLPIYWVRTLQTEIDADTWFYKVFGNLFGVFGIAALFLASVGLYGVMSFAARRRTQEMGIRLALGAQPNEVIGMMLRGGIWQMIFGLGLGVGLAMLLASGLELILFQVETLDVGIYIGVIVALIATGLLANLIPAGRASRIDPIIALRPQ
jgi:predicted permease